MSTSPGTSPVTSPIDLLFEDKRSIADMSFGAEEKTPEARANTTARVREMLSAMGVRVADDINHLGCTGVLAKEYAIEHAQFLRLGLAGGGVGLPCFVPISRYCLVHQTIGGLEPGQKQHHPEFVEQISRELTPVEKGKVALIEQARRGGRKDRDKAADILGGRDESMLEEVPSEEVPAILREDVKVYHVNELAQQLHEARLDASLQAEAREQAEARAFKCPEHAKLNWACRHCVAQAIVEGPLEPLFFVTSGKPGSREVTDLGPGQALGHCVIAGAVEVELGTCDALGDTEADVFVRVASYTRKLSRN